MKTKGRTSPTTPVRFGPEFPLLIAWATIGFAATRNIGRYDPLDILLIIAAVALIVVVVADGAPPRSGRGAAIGLAVALGTAIVVAAFYPAGLYGYGLALTVSHRITLVATIATAVFAATLARRSTRLTRWFSYAVIVAMTGAGIAMVRASPAPVIDVWQMLQAASSTLGHGHNFYVLHWSPHILGEVWDQYVYFPSGVLMLAPFHWLFGDIRYGVIAAMAVTGVILTKVAGRAWWPLLGTLVLLYPKATYSIEQAWLDPLLLACFCLAAYAVETRHPNWAVVALALALCCKQTPWLLLPLAAAWAGFGWRRTLASIALAVGIALPFIVTTPHAFFSGSILYSWRQAPRTNALSIYTYAVLHGRSPGFLFTCLVTLVAIALALWRAPRDTYGFLLGSALVMAAFNISDKQVFFNEWELTAGLILAAVAFGSIRGRVSESAGSDRDQTVPVPEGSISLSDAVTSARPWSPS